MLSQNEPIKSATPQDKEIKLIKQLEKVLAPGSQPKMIDSNGEQVVKKEERRKK